MHECAIEYRVYRHTLGGSIREHISNSKHKKYLSEMVGRNPGE